MKRLQLLLAIIKIRTSGKLDKAEYFTCNRLRTAFQKLDLDTAIVNKEYLVLIPKNFLVHDDIIAVGQPKAELRKTALRRFFFKVLFFKVKLSAY